MEEIDDKLDKQNRIFTDGDGKISPTAFKKMLLNACFDIKYQTDTCLFYI